MNSSIYLIPIQNLKENYIPDSHYQFLGASVEYSRIDHYMKAIALRILIGHQHEDHPKVKALWKKETKELYLVSSSLPTPVSRTDEKGVTERYMRKHKAVWIEIDIESLSREETIRLVKRVPPIFNGDGEDATELEQGRDDCLLTIRNG